MAVIITSPDLGPRNVHTFLSKKLFIAGGITNCPDWQSRLVELLKPIPNLVVDNSRPTKPAELDSYGHETFKYLENRTVWEYERLRDADYSAMWFSRGSNNSMSMYELGMWMTSRDTPGHSRNRSDVSKT